MTKAQTTSAQVGTCCCHRLSPACPSTRQATNPMTTEGTAGAMGSPRAGTATVMSRTRETEGIEGFPGDVACPPGRTSSEVVQPQEGLITGQHRLLTPVAV